MPTWAQLCVVDIGSIYKLMETLIMFIMATIINAGILGLFYLLFGSIIPALICTAIFMAICAGMVD